MIIKAPPVSTPCCKRGPQGSQGSQGVAGTAGGITGCPQATLSESEVITVEFGEVLDGVIAAEWNVDYRTLESIGATLGFFLSMLLQVTAGTVTARLYVGATNSGSVVGATCITEVSTASATYVALDSYNNGDVPDTAIVQLVLNGQFEATARVRGLSIQITCPVEMQTIPCSV